MAGALPSVPGRDNPNSFQGALASRAALQQCAELAVANALTAAAVAPQTPSRGNEILSVSNLLRRYACDTHACTGTEDPNRPALRRPAP